MSGSLKSKNLVFFDDKKLARSVVYDDGDFSFGIFKNPNGKYYICIGKNDYLEINRSNLTTLSGVVKHFLSYTEDNIVTIKKKDTEEFLNG